MRTHTEYLTFHTKKRRELVHLTPKVDEILARGGLQEGLTRSVLVGESVTVADFVAAYTLDVASMVHLLENLPNLPTTRP